MQERLHDQKFISNFFKAKLFTDEEEEEDEKEDEEDDDRKEVSGETCRKDVSTGASISWQTSSMFEYSLFFFRRWHDHEVYLFSW